jgi:hypothetical protein
VNDNGFGIHSNQFGFNLLGTSGQTVIILGSTNLENWVPLATNKLGSNSLFFSDSAITNGTSRFYRATTP